MPVSDPIDAIALEDEPGQIVAPVPEPSAALIFGIGLLVAGVAARRRR